MKHKTYSLVLLYFMISIGCNSSVSEIVDKTDSQKVVIADTTKLDSARYISLKEWLDSGKIIESGMSLYSYTEQLYVAYNHLACVESGLDNIGTVIGEDSLGLYFQTEYMWEYSPLSSYFDEDVGKVYIREGLLNSLFIRPDIYYSNKKYTEEEVRKKELYTKSKIVKNTNY